MLMRALSVHIAHETAGAARIRHSLRPLISWGERILKTSGEMRRGNADVCLELRRRRSRYPVILRRERKRASKDESATDGPSSFEARKSAHLRVTDFR